MLVSETYYNGTYYGEPIEPTDHQRFEARAEDMILRLVHHTAEEVEAMPEATLNAVRMAICAQMEYLAEYGMTVGTFGKTAGGFTVGKVSVQGGSSAATDAGARSMYCAAVYSYLERTGLLNPSVATLAEPWPERWWI